MDKEYRENRPINVPPTDKDAMAANLRLHGYTLRSVTKMMGYDSTDEAYQAINKFMRIVGSRRRGYVKEG